MANISGATSIGESAAPPPMRKAVAGDLPFLVTVLEMASRGHLERGPWDLMFPEAAERQRALAHVASDAPVSWCHTRWFHVAESAGTASAAMVAFEAGDLGGDTSLAAPLMETFSWLGWSPERVSQVIALVEPYAACFPDMPAGTWIVENVGTREDARRQGLVRTLLERALAEGRQRGLARAQISCLIGNDAAQRAYERAGFEVVEEKRDEHFERLIGSPGFFRMVTELECA